MWMAQTEEALVKKIGPCNSIPVVTISKTTLQRAYNQSVWKSPIQIKLSIRVHLKWLQMRQETQCLCGLLKIFQMLEKLALFTELSTCSSMLRTEVLKSWESALTSSHIITITFVHWPQKSDHQIRKNTWSGRELLAELWAWVHSYGLVPFLSVPQVEGSQVLFSS